MGLSFFKELGLGVEGMNIIYISSDWVSNTWSDNTLVLQKGFDGLVRYLAFLLAFPLAFLTDNNLDINSLKTYGESMFC